MNFDLFRARKVDAATFEEVQANWMVAMTRRRRALHARYFSLHISGAKELADLSYKVIEALEKASFDVVETPEDAAWLHELTDTQSLLAVAASRTLNNKAPTDRALSTYLRMSDEERSRISTSTTSSITKAAGRTNPASRAE